MSPAEFAARLARKIEERRTAELEAMATTLLDHPTYAKRHGAAKAYQAALNDIEEVLASAKLDQDDEIEEDGN